MKPYTSTVKECLRFYRSDQSTGLTEEEVRQRLSLYGNNLLPEVATKSWMVIFLQQFQNPLIYILLLAALLIFLFGEDPTDAFIISGVLFFNALVGTIQEGRTRTILSTLKKFTVSTTLVVRDGKKQVIKDQELVPGDIVFLSEGQHVPADGRIIEEEEATLNEAILTGESFPVAKTCDALTGEVPLVEQKNMLFKGTYLASGRATFIVTTTGLQTHIGTIYQQASEHSETAMPLRRDLDYFSYLILLFILGVCVFLFIVGLATGKPIQELFTMLTALFICVVPEGLPIVLTLILVTGVYRMAQRRVLIKKMQAIEALGRINVIVTDKTGTLTRNEMMVTTLGIKGYNVDLSEAKGSCDHLSKVLSPEQYEDYVKLATLSLLLNTTTEVVVFEGNRSTTVIKGDPTEAAMYRFAKDCGMEEKIITEQYQKLYEAPFDSKMRYHGALYTHKGQHLLFFAGAPELLLGYDDQGSREITPLLQESLEKGLRIVALAEKQVDLPLSHEHWDEASYKTFMHQSLSSGVRVIGFVGIADAVRPEVADIIKKAQSVGIRVVMATGDHSKTARYVAQKVGIIQKGMEILEGKKFDTLSQDELLSLVDKVAVFARVSPTHKITIIELLHKKGHIVAMTGDGINDVPSLLAADVGIAMGEIGTDAAKEAADIVLLDDSFVYVIEAIEQGRHIFYTLRRVILYFFATNMGEILVVLFALVMNMPLPITAAQILWLNLVTDGFLDLALSMEPREPLVLSKRNDGSQLRIIDVHLLLKMMWMALPMGVGSLYMFTRYYTVDIAYARTLTLLTMSMYQWFNAWNCRSETRSLFSLGLFTNRWLILATTGVFILQLFLVYSKPLQLL
ncbi:MAG: HAD-IC family P-type ATPase, partial [Candidatus Babeliales bacterium]